MDKKMAPLVPHSNIISLNYQWRIVAWIMVILLGVLAGMRPTFLWADYVGYYSLYNDLGQVPFSNFNPFIYREEPLFVTLYYLFSVSGIPFFVSTLCIALVSVSLKCISFIRYRCDLPTALLVYAGHYYLMMEWNVIRAGISSGLIYLSVYNLVARNRFRSLAFFTLAIGFHQSSLVILLILPLIAMDTARHCLSYVSITLILIVSAVAFQSGLGHVFTSLLSTIGLDSIPLAFSLVNYSDWDLYNQSIGVFDLNTIKCVVILYVSRYLGSVGHREFEHEFHRSLFDNISLIFLFGIIFRIAFNDFSILAGRGSAVMLSFEPILLGMAATMRSDAANITPTRMFAFFLFSITLLYNTTVLQTVQQS